MKNINDPFSVSAVNVGFLKGLFPAVFLCLFIGLKAEGQASFEVMCRSKAKEIAAETYKNCVTDQRQAQLEQIRGEYKEKLSALKNHYDAELRKMGGASNAAAPVVVKSGGAKAPAINLGKKSGNNKPASRASGARSLPTKTVRTETIDFTSPTPASAVSPATAPSIVTEIPETEYPQETRLRTNPEESADLEIVELPTQE